MKLTTKIIFPTGVVFLAAGFAIIFIFQAYLKQQMADDFFVSHGDQAERSAEQFLSEADFSDPSSASSHQHFRNFFQSLGAMEIIHIVVWDNSAKVIAASDQYAEKTEQQLGEKDRANQAINSRTVLINRNGAKENQQSVGSALEQFPYDYEVYVPIFLEGKMFGVAELQLSSVFVDQITKRLILMVSVLCGMFALLMFALIVFLVHKFIIDPAGQIVAASEALQMGNWNVPVASKKRKDEMGNLAESFEQMRDSLRKAFKSLEERVNVSEQILLNIINFSPDGIFAIDKDGRVIIWNEEVERMTGVKKANIVGKGNYEHSLTFYGERKPILIDLALTPDVDLEKKYPTLIRDGNSLTGENFTPNTFGGQGNYCWGKAAPIYDSQKNIVGAIEVVRDITEKKNFEMASRRSETRLEWELKVFSGLYALVMEMSTEKNIDQNLQYIVEKCREIFSTDVSFIALCDENRDFVNMHTITGIKTEEFIDMKLPFGKGVGGLVIKDRKGFIVEDYLASKDIIHVVDDIMKKEGLISGIAVPIQTESEDLGVLYVFNRKKTGFTDEDLRTLELFGRLASIEIVRKRSEKLLSKKLDEQERFSTLTVDREMKMIELKKKIKELESKIKDKKSVSKK